MIKVGCLHRGGVFEHDEIVVVWDVAIHLNYPPPLAPKSAEPTYIEKGEDVISLKAKWWSFR